MNTTTEQRVLVPFEVIQDGRPKVNRIEERATGNEVKALLVVMDTDGDSLFSVSPGIGHPLMLTFSPYQEDEDLTVISIPSLTGWSLWADGYNTLYPNRLMFCFVKL